MSKKQKEVPFYIVTICHFKTSSSTPFTFEYASVTRTYLTQSKHFHELTNKTINQTFTLLMSTPKYAQTSHTHILSP